MNKNYKAWISDDGISVEPKLNVAYVAPGSETFTTVSFPAQLLTKIEVSGKESSSGNFSVRATLGQQGDPYLVIEKEPVCLGLFKDSISANKAVSTINRALGLGARRIGRVEAAAFFSLGLLVASLLAGVYQLGGSNSNPVSIPSFSFEQEVSPPSLSDPELGFTEEQKSAAPTAKDVMREVYLSGTYFQGKKGETMASFAVFSDPSCPSCSELEEMAEKLDAGYLVVPVGLLNEQSRAVSTQIFCSESPVDAYKDHFNGKDTKLDNPDEEAVLECADQVLKNNAYFTLLGTSAVPTMVRLIDYEVRSGLFESQEEFVRWVEGADLPDKEYKKPVEGAVE